MTACTKTRLLGRSEETARIVQLSHPDRSISRPHDKLLITQYLDAIFTFQDL
jgi:hypothetical protein